MICRTGCNPATSTCNDDIPEECAEIPRIHLGDPKNFNTCEQTDDASPIRGGNCPRDEPALGGDRIFRLEIEHRGRYRISLRDASAIQDIDVVVYVRTHCDDALSQITCMDSPCSLPACLIDETVVDVALEPGVYYVRRGHVPVGVWRRRLRPGEAHGHRSLRDRLNLILFEPAELAGEPSQLRVNVRDERAAHLREVLRVGVGDEVRVGVIGGPRGKGRVIAVDDDGVTLECELGSAIAERPAVDVILAVPRPKVLKRLWAPLASLGVGRVALVNAAKVERFYFDSHAVQPEHIRPRLIAGLSQASDTRLPEISVERELKPFVEDRLEAWSGDARCVLAAVGARRSLLEIAQRTDPSRRVVVAIGPEGGWTSFERDLFQRHGFVAASLGPRVLRTDVATIAIVAILHEGLGVPSAGSRP